MPKYVESGRFVLGQGGSAGPPIFNIIPQKNSVFLLWVMMSTSMFLPMIFIIRR